MKKYYVFLYIIFGNLNLNAQVLNQDSEGRSSIVWSGSTFGFDVTEALVKINYYKFPQDPKGIVWGIDLQGKNNEGIVGLFDEGKFTPNATFSGLIGYKSSQFIFRNNGISKLILKQERLNEQIVNDGPNIEAHFSKLISGYIKGCGENDNATNSLVKALKAITNYQKLSTQILQALLKIDIKDCKVLAEEIIVLAKAVDKDKIINNYQKLEKERDEVSRLINNTSYFDSDSDFIIYGRGGLRATEFTYDNGNIFNSFNTRFIDTLHIGRLIELGVTFRVNRLFLGGSLGFSRINNFSSLEKSEYKYSSNDSTLTGGILQSTKTVTAYTGEYGIFNNFYLMVDAFYMINLRQNDSYLSLGVYYRDSMSNIVLDEKSIFGIGSYFINGKAGKFLGGFYVQTNDIYRETEIRFNKTLSFGLIGKLALSDVSPKTN